MVPLQGCRWPLVCWNAKSSRCCPNWRRWALANLSARADLAASQRSQRSLLAEDLSMTHVLVVDDSAVDRRLAGSLLEKCHNASVRYAADGNEALARMREQAP